MNIEIFLKRHPEYRNINLEEFIVTEQINTPWGILPKTTIDRKLPQKVREELSELLNINIEIQDKKLGIKKSQELNIENNQGNEGGAILGWLIWSALTMFLVFLLNLILFSIKK